jgi:hypothetical protein
MSNDDYSITVGNNVTITFFIMQSRLLMVSWLVHDRTKQK